MWGFTNSVLTAEMIKELEGQVTVGTELYFPRIDARGRVMAIERTLLEAVALNRAVGTRFTCRVRMEFLNGQAAYQDWTVGELIDESMPFQEWLKVMSHHGIPEKPTAVLAPGRIFRV